MSEKSGKLKRMFRAEGRAMLAKLGRVLTQIESGSEEAGLVDRAFRFAHSLKSEAAFLEYDTLAETAHRLEEHLAALRSGGSDRSGLMDLLVQAEAQFEAAAERISVELADTGERANERAANEVSRGAGLVDRVDQRARRQLREARARNEHVYHIQCRLSSDPDARFPRAFLVLNNLEVRCNVIAVYPDVEAPAGAAGGALEMLVTSTGDQQRIHDALGVDEVEDVQVVEETYERYLEVPGERYRPSMWHEDVTFRMKTPAYEELCLYVDELWLAVHESADDRLRFMANQVRGRVSATSTVELVDLLGELSRRLRSYADERGKRVRLEVAGGSGPVFLPVADLLVEAILHLVRNAVEHGIESAHERSVAGKQPEGVVSVTVEREHTVLRVRVADDGAGVDEIRVRKAAGGNGGALLDVLATPGFSTAPEGGVAAGRGVGLDAVVHSIREVLGGSVRLNNHVGRGFAVEMTIPNAGRQYGVLLVKAGTSVYAVPASGVVDHGELDPRWVRHDSLGNRYYEYLGERLELIALEGAEIGRTGTVVVLSAGDRRAALLVESVLGEEAVVRDLNQPGRVYASTVNRDARLLLPFDILGST